MELRSMTGYGKGEQVVSNKKICVEIRTLNGKQLDLSLKMPSSYRKDEFELRTMITKGVGRGKCDVYINCESIDTALSMPINFEIFEGYYKQLTMLGKEHGFDAQSPEIVQSILRMPDVMQNDKSDASNEEFEALRKATSDAIKNLNAFRDREGSVLIADIMKRISLIETLQGEIKQYEIERIETVRARLRENLEALKITVDQNRFEQELIYYLEKLDITEEMVRLSQHLKYFREVCSGDEAPGRKIGFISQEIGREINTTGSKANHSEIQKIVVRMKDELEKIKEQSLNLL
ncbi:MAG: YicC/YloC family endoribonuclease [Rikenellaceae bacterium]